MKRFSISYKSTVINSIEVDAESEKEALEKATKLKDNFAEWFKTELNKTGFHIDFCRDLDTRKGHEEKTKHT